MKFTKLPEDSAELDVAQPVVQDNTEAHCITVGKSQQIGGQGMK